VTDFMNLKIKPAQSFGGANRGRMCVCVHMDKCSYTYEYLRLYCVSKKYYKLPKVTWDEEENM
jgi:hypothetical protein